jgi:hypothetical protein
MSIVMFVDLFLVLIIHFFHSCFLKTHIHLASAVFLNYLLCVFSVSFFFFFFLVHYMYRDGASR